MISALSEKRHFLSIEELEDISLYTNILDHLLMSLAILHCSVVMFPL